MYIYLRNSYISCEEISEAMEDPDEDPICFENTVNFYITCKISNQKKSLFLFSNFQYMATFIVFSIGPPFREQWYKNALFLLTYITLLGCCIYLLIYPTEFGIEFFSVNRFFNEDSFDFLISCMILTGS